MVTKRELAAAQQAMIDWSGPLVALARRYPGGVIHVDGSIMQGFCAAYESWDALRKQLDGEGPAVARSTSIAAGKANIMAKQSLRRTILQVIVGHWDHFGWGMTSDEIQGRLKGKHQSVSARISELVNTYGLLVDTGKKAETSSGAKAILWGPTPEAIELVHAAYRGAE